MIQSRNFKGNNTFDGYVGEVYRWTNEAIMCYQRNCRCSGCIHEKGFESTKCRMKPVIRELVIRFGVPRKVINGI